mmetsp:Transcript_23128/g.59082  ORF Transcript_23128/g.59082 Transcript_23128/m.59082 type:complete len:289 (-) Transcript_23128:1648-2514(-)|eukprot:CAMPEP_0202864206 /NCGR_PEP_ID=MMETSP1391-20130828/4536_1 /ASSEMBLY_ACC=CAM_ASM_000867 /TAXON_ID=1034604 /ORGANISM="Chlamydomonas leiostraca, Strain SAG 11-49" /LENGTH=288 /DNA_ID=CAMNT_0049543925 /DNA_START=200 /DNA_END=1066 /DNA_ORIENTATION=+
MAALGVRVISPPSTSSAAPRTSTISRRSAVKVFASRGFSQHNKFTDPYSVLGVTPDVDEKQIKRAYRKLAKQFHPDVSQEEQAEARFVAITEAYEFLVNVLSGRGMEGSHPNSKGNSQAFHDWYWSFRMSRTWDSQKGGRPSPASPPTTPQSEEGLRSQLAGLRHRAAMRKVTEARGSGSESESEAAPPAQQPRASCGSSVDEQAAEPQPEQLYVAADGPSDSADPSVRAAAGTGAASGMPPGARRRFVANSDERTSALREQMAGMRRKAMLKAQQQHATASNQTPYV